MKLDDVKECIDRFFDTITAEDLYEISILKYGFSEIIMDIENKHFETGKISYYSATKKSVFENKNNEEYNIALAA